MDEEKLLKLLEEYDKSRVNDVSLFLDSDSSETYHQYVLNLLSNAVAIKIIGVLKVILEKDGICINENSVKLTKSGEDTINDLLTHELKINKFDFLNREDFEQNKLRVRNLVEDKKVDRIKHSQYPHLDNPDAPQPKKKKSNLLSDL